MAERTDELTRDDDTEAVSDDVGVDGDAFDFDDAGLTGDVTDSDASFDVGDRTTDRSTGPSRTGRVKRRAESVFSPSNFVLQLVAALVGAFVLGNLIPVIPFAGFLGIFLLAGLLGTLSSRPRYVEAAVAGGASGALALFFDAIGMSVVTGGALPVVGAAVGALASLAGFYAGRDLRDGVTRDL